MAVLHERVTVGTTAVLLAQAGTDRDGINVMIQSAKGGSTEVYIGGAGVTSTSYGHHIDPDEHFDITLASGEALYGITASGTHILNVLRTSA
jgi:hypothetical protein